MLVSPVEFILLRASPPPTAALDEKRSFAPPAVHARSEMVIEAAVNAVTWVGLEPSGFITQTFCAVPFGTSVLPPSSVRADRNAILLPSGDQAALKVLMLMPAVSWVSAVRFEPSGFTTQIF